MPRKSLMRGMAILTKRSRNSYMRSPRRVTLQPIAWPSRTLNVATDFLAFVTAGFCPVILAMSAVAASMTFLSATASPTPMFTVIFKIRGTCMVFFSSSFCLSSGTIFSLKICFSLAAINYPLFRVDHFFVRLEQAHLAAVLERLEPDPIALLGRRIENHHVRHMQRRLGLDDAALHAGLRIGVLMPLGHVEPPDAQTVLRPHFDHGAFASLGTTGDQNHRVAFANLLHHSTSGASEIIFMNCTLRSSRVTGPKIRVPMGSSLLVSSTAALVSKRISDPSARRTPLLVRTTTASYTSPFFTLPRGIASFTLTLMTSPTAA